MTPILKELPQLVADNVISAQTAADIRQYYANKKVPESNLLLSVFGVLGSALVGLGIILIFAHNWDDFPRITKTMLAFLPLVVFQGLTAYTLVAKKSNVWKEAAGTLLFFAVGSSIALVAQIYNLPGSMGSFLCTWIVLCLPLIYLLRSNALAILHMVFITWYAVEVGYDNDTQPYLYLLLLALFIPFYYMLIKQQASSNITAVMHWLVPLSTIIVFGSFVNDNFSFVAPLYMAFFCLLYAIGRLTYFSPFKRTGYTALSEAGIIFVLFVGTFLGFWDEHQNVYPSVGLCITFIVILVTAIYLTLLNRKTAKETDWTLWAGFTFPVLFLSSFASEALATVLGNLVVLALGCLIIKQGVDKLNFRSLNFGLLIVSALTICRFFDTDMSFAIRGLLFLAVGIGFFAANYLVARKKRINS
jgi:uncharacterized membrane protein